jgi:hypothetical protein
VGFALVRISAVQSGAALMRFPGRMRWTLAFGAKMFARKTELDNCVEDILVAIVISLGPFIKRFGKSYAAEVFRSNPGTGKSFIVLTDFAYYLIFGAYVLFTLIFKRPSDWTDTVNATQLKTETVKIAGIFLLMGVLHGANLLMLPIIGRLLTLNRQLDLEMRKTDSHKAKQR